MVKRSVACVASVSVGFQSKKSPKNPTETLIATQAKRSEDGY